MVVSKKNRMKETLNDYMRGLAIDNPEMRDLEAIFSGIQAITSFILFPGKPCACLNSPI